MSPWLTNRRRRQKRRRGGVSLGALVGMAIVAGCVTLPGHVAAPEFTPRVVDREYRVVWETLLAALRNEGAQIVVRNPDDGVIDTAFRARPGTKVMTRGILGRHETRQPLAEVRYSVRARSLDSTKTEVRLRTQIQYLDGGTQQWVSALDDGSLMEAFWRRFEQDLAYYGARPETWRPGTPDVSPGGAAPGIEAR